MVAEEAEGGGTAKRRKKGRSPSYPGINLETAIERTRTLFDAEGSQPVRVDAILADWGYKPRSGGGLVALAALKKFGLLSDQGSGDDREAQLTPRALTILLEDENSDARREAIQEAALAPPIHREVWERYEGQLPAANSGLRSYLVRDRSFTDGGANEFIQELRATISFAGLDDDGTLPAEARDTQDLEGGRRMGAADTLTPPRGSPEMKTVQLPVTGQAWPELKVPWPMKPETWRQMLAYLELMMPALVEESSSPSEPEEASEADEEEEAGG